MPSGQLYGILFLPNVTSVSHGIRTVVRMDTIFGTSNLSSIKARDLTFIGNLRIAKCPLLTDVSFPDLPTADGISFQGVGEAT